MYVCVYICILFIQPSPLPFVTVTLVTSCCSLAGGLHGAEEPGAEAQQHAPSQDGVGADAPLHLPSGVRRLPDSQVPLNAR